MKTGLLSTAIALMVSAVSASAAETPPSAPSAFDLLPEDTPMTLILDTTDETWSQLSQFQLFSLVKAYTGTDPNLGGLPYLPLEIPYETAVAPWIGDSAVLALMPLPDETAKLQNQSLLAAPIANFAAFDGFLEQIAAARNEDFVEEPYRNVAIYVWPPEALPAPEQPDPETPQSLLHPAIQRLLPAAALPDAVPEPEFEIEPETPEPLPPMVPPLAVAVLPGYLIVSNQAAPIRQLIDTHLTQAPTLIDSPHFQKRCLTPTSISPWLLFLAMSARSIAMR